MTFADLIKQNNITEIAKLPQARFEWWIQKTFQVLPTDPRFINLTEEQMDLIYEHYKLDNPEPVKQKVVNPETGEEEPPESYHDPEFMDLWNELDEADSNSDTEDSTIDEWEEV